MFLGCAVRGSRFWSMYAMPTPTCYYGKMDEKGKVVLAIREFLSRRKMREWVNHSCSFNDEG